MFTTFKFICLSKILMLGNNIFSNRFNVTTHQQNQHTRKLPIIQSSGKQLSCLGEILSASKFINSTQLIRKLKIATILHTLTTTLTICMLLLGANSASAGIVILNVPTTIQADGYSIAAGVKNEPTTDSGGGNDTGSIDAGDWMSYLNKQVVIPVTGYYYVNFRVSSLRGGGSFVFNDIGSTVTKLDTVAVPKTNGWQTWTTVQRKIYLKSGSHYFGIQAITGGFNLNWFQISVPITASLPVATSSAASSKSSVKSSASSSKSSVASSAKSSAGSSAKSAVASSVKTSVASSAKSAAASSVKSAASTSKASSAAAIDPLYTHVAGPVGLSWVAPKQREDKSILDITELGGYQLRYKSYTDKAFTYITIIDPWARTYNFTWLEGDYIFQIAAFDLTGGLSDFAYFTD